MKQYNKLGLIAIVTLLLLTLLGMNVADLAKLTEYEPLATDNTLLVNLAIEGALVFITLKIFLYTFGVYLGIVQFYKVYQKDIDKKKSFNEFKELIKDLVNTPIKASKQTTSAEWGDMDEKVNNAIAKDGDINANTNFNPKVVDLQFEPKKEDIHTNVPNRLKLECYDSFDEWERAVANEPELDMRIALTLNKFIFKAKQLIKEAMLTKITFHSQPKFIVENIDLTLNEIDEVKEYLTNELGEYINSLVPVLKPSNLKEYEGLKGDFIE